MSAFKLPKLPKKDSSNRYTKTKVKANPGSACTSFTPIAICPRSSSQSRYVDLMRAEGPSIVVGYGDAGCGKTFLAAQVGGQKLFSRQVQRLIITRPAMGAGEDIGFLPGTLLEKMMPFIRPVYDVLRTHLSDKAIEQLVEDKAIEVVPVAFMRGRSFDDSFIIVDEGQNCTPNQLFMLLTRVGKNTKIVITGDPNQSDLISPSLHLSSQPTIDGLSDLLARIRVSDPDGTRFGVVQFGPDDCQRDPIVPEVIEMYGMRSSRAESFP